MPEKNLNDVIDELSALRDDTVNVNNAIDDLVAVTENFLTILDKKFDQDALNKKEEEQESSRRIPRGRAGLGLEDSFKAGLAAGSGFSIINLINPAKLLKLVFGAAAAGGAAYAGLRGWETKFISSFFERFFTNLGLTKDGKLPPIDDASRVSVVSKITGAMAKLENRILSWFGISTEGALLRDAGGRFTGGRATRITLVERITAAISKLFSPVRTFAKAVDDWIIGPGAKVIGFVTGFSGIGAFATLAKKILFPIGIIMSAVDAVKEWRNSEEANSYLKFGDAIGAFLGDFVGAPLDLLKLIVGKALGWVGLQKAEDWLASFSFEDGIKNLISNVIRLPKKILNSASTQVNNSIKTMKLGIGTSIDNFLNSWDNISKYIRFLALDAKTSVLNSLDRSKIGYLKVSNFLQNIPDRLLSLVTNMLDFTIPKISIPYDNWLMGQGEMVLFNGGKPFGNIAKIGETADQMVAARNIELDKRVERLGSNIAERLKILDEETKKLFRESNSGGGVNIVAPTNNSSVNTNQTVIQSFPSPFNEYAPQ